MDFDQFRLKFEHCLAKIEIVLKLTIDIEHILINFIVTIELDSKNLDQKLDKILIENWLKSKKISKWI